MSFETVYDLREAGCRLGLLPIFGLFLTLAAALLWRRQRSPALGRESPATQWAGYALLFFIVFTLMTFFATWAQYWTLLERMERGRAKTLEGFVREFYPASSVKAVERFRVRNRMFSYGRFQTQQGFHTLREDGGPIEQGVNVRILYFNNHILRLEVSAPCGTSDCKDRTASPYSPPQTD